MSSSSSQQVQHLGFNKESQHFEADGVGNEIFQASLNFGDLKDKVKTEADEQFLVDYTWENFGMTKVSKVT